MHNTFCAQALPRYITRTADQALTLLKGVVRERQIQGESHWLLLDSTKTRKSEEFCYPSLCNLNVVSQKNTAKNVHRSERFFFITGIFYCLKMNIIIVKSLTIMS